MQFYYKTLKRMGSKTKDMKKDIDRKKGNIVIM